MTSTFKYFLIATIICASFFATIRAQDEVQVEGDAIPVTITDEDWQPFLQEDVPEADVASIASFGGCNSKPIQLTPKELKGGLMAKLVDWAFNLLIKKLVKEGKIPAGSYKFIGVKGTKASDCRGGWYFDLEIIFKNKCTMKCYEFSLKIHVSKWWIPTLVSCEVKCVPCNTPCTVHEMPTPY